MRFIRLLKVNIVCLLILSLLTTNSAWAKNSLGAMSSKAYILVEANSNAILAQYRANDRLSPASITKLMTAYVVYENIAQGLIALDDKVVVSPRARSMGGSRMFLEQGSHVSIDDLLNGLVVQSGNDAAVALAEAVAGDEERFVKLMNKQAKSLGLSNSQFKNVSGLTEAGHYMSAQDIAVLSSAIIRNFPVHYRRYSKRAFTWNNITQDNRNVLLRSNPNVDGLKTGHTRDAGYCLASSAKRGNMRLISIVLGATNTSARVKASKKLLSYGFSNFSNQTLYQAGQKIAVAQVDSAKVNTIGVTTRQQVVLPLDKNTPAKGLSVKLLVDRPLTAPLKAGEKIGEISILRDDEELVRLPAITMTEVEELGWLEKLWNYLVETLLGWFT